MTNVDVIARCGACRRRYTATGWRELRRIGVQEIDPGDEYATRLELRQCARCSSTISVMLTAKNEKHPRMVLRPATIEAFRRDPLGRFVLGPTFVVWCLDATLCGVTYWGRPSVADLRLLIPLLGIVEAHPHMRRPFDVLTDGRLVEDIDLSALRVLAAFLARRLGTYAKRIRRNAIVHRDGVSIVGATLVGLYRLLGPRYLWATFTNRREALAWFGRADTDATAAQLDLLPSGAIGDGADLMTRVRALLARAPSTTQTEAAALFGLSVRSLQRRLSVEGVTFREERARARLRRAREVSATAAGVKLEGVAREAGYASGSGLRSALRRRKPALSARGRKRER